LDFPKLEKAVKDSVAAFYKHRQEELGPIFGDVQKHLLLTSIDSHWKEHLLNMDLMKEGISLRAYGQKDPLVEYKKEAFNLYSEMDYTIKAETIERLMKIQIAREEEAKELAPQPKRQRMNFSHGQEPVNQAPVTRDDKVGRNDPCPCGSGKKYKKCHGAEGL
jgi:preprotein translocase subunit SecA